MYIYADILIITNFYVDFLLIKSASLITHTPLRKGRALAASAVGSLFSLAIFLPRTLGLAAAAIKLLSAFIIVYTAFGFEGRAAFFRRTVVFYLCAFVYGGVGTGISYITGGRFLISRHGVIYADFSFPALVITSIASYICLEVYRRFSDRGGGTGYTVTVLEKGRTVSFPAAADTGNFLRDSFTGKYVIVCPKGFLEELYGEIPDVCSFEADGSFSVKRWRFIPYSTVSTRGLIAIIYPESVCIKNDETGELCRADAYLGAAEENAGLAVFNPEILI